MNAIVVVDQNWDIGKDGGLLVHLPGDLAYFRKKTLNKIVVVGRKTLESFPGKKPLPGRTNVVLTRNETYKPEGCTVLHTKEAVIDTFGKGEDVFISGGEEIYRQFFQDCDTFFVTKIYAAFDGDRQFPNLDEREEFEIVGESQVQEERDIRYQFFTYKRK